MHTDTKSTSGSSHAPAPVLPQGERRRALAGALTAPGNCAFAFTNYLRASQNQFREFRFDTFGRPVGFAGGF